MTFVSMSFGTMISHCVICAVAGAVIGGLIVYSVTKSVVK